MSAEIGYVVNSRVAVVTLNRPDRKNAITATMGRAYNAALLRAADDPDVVAVVITGAGSAFSAGAELSVIEGLSDGSTEPDSGEGEFSPAIAREIRKPVIAAINGAAAGVGLAIALYADFRVVAEDATLTTRYSRLGLVAEYGLAWLLPRLVGDGRARELLLTGRRFSGAEAHAMNLAQWVCPADQVLTLALELAGDISDSCAPHALAIIKDQLEAADSSNLATTYERANALMQQSFTSPDLAEMMVASKKGQRPQFRRWEGRHEIYR